MNKVRARIGVTHNLKVWIFPVPPNALIAVVYVPQDKFLALQEAFHTAQTIIDGLATVLPFGLVCEAS